MHEHIYMVMHASTCTLLVIHANMYVYRGTSVTRRGIYIRHIHIEVYCIEVEEGTRRTLFKHSVYWRRRSGVGFLGGRSRVNVLIKN